MRIQQINKNVVRLESAEGVLPLLAALVVDNKLASQVWLTMLQLGSDKRMHHYMHHNDYEQLHGFVKSTLLQPPFLIVLRCGYIVGTMELPVVFDTETPSGIPANIIDTLSKQLSIYM